MPTRRLCDIALWLFALAMAYRTVVMLGMFTTRIRTSLGEEVCLPNRMIFSMPIRHLPPVVKEGMADPPDNEA
ncbi:mechanosensitive ion channel domain-containing protein [Hydrogenophaga sp.]|uniref:mechanosensitive ion channel domain-containing protein n=1 Tax=Hydrogenophaga sp. TaxID=1904254 RepID=UPI00272F15B8|nr:mechanosensitive ion channel domain-containing protein [Hydrogenophaga sp.]MDP2017037.1 hypothetical protein [Hydrogenophaga sp.]